MGAVESAQWVMGTLIHPQPTIIEFNAGIPTIHLGQGYQHQLYIEPSWPV